jgi:hypothetical protein
MSESPEGSFNAHVMNNKEMKNDVSGGMLSMLSSLLIGHAKTIACCWVVLLAALKGRDKSKDSITVCQWLQMRIPLGLKVRHSVVMKAEDEIFNGIQYIVNNDDGPVMLHAEFMGLTKDGYSPMKDASSSVCSQL